MNEKKNQLSSPALVSFGGPEAGCWICDSDGGPMIGGSFSEESSASPSLEDDGTGGWLFLFSE